MTSVCIVGHDTCINILIFRVNTAETVFAARRIKASVTADLDHAVFTHKLKRKKRMNHNQ